MKKIFSASLITLVSAYSSFSSALSHPSEVIVLEGAADLDHVKLKNFQNKNLGELNGQPGVDDDQDGFVDNISGWNFVSSDAHFMPDYIRSFFVTNDRQIKEMLEIYTRIENGDIKAEMQVQLNPSLQESLDIALSLSHATHVSGIVAMNSQDSAQIQNLNIFEKSSPEQDDSTESPRPNPAAAVIPNLSSAAQRFRQYAVLNRANELPESEMAGVEVAGPGAAAQPSTSEFDRRENIDTFLANEKNTVQSMAVQVAEYLKKSGAGGVNVSLGWTTSALEANFNQIWFDELSQNQLPKTTPKNDVQQANFQYLVKSDFAIWKAFWETVVSANPDVLFVVSAGNDGDAKNPSSGNNDLIDEVPANFNLRFGNVISVAATDQRGVLTDFSSFGARTVNLGAPGKAIASYAPNDNEVAMSGTSMSSPAVAGIAASLRKANPNLSATEVRSILQDTGKSVDSLVGKTTTGKIVDAAAALAAARGELHMNLSEAIRNANESRQSLAANFRHGGGALLMTDLSALSTARGDGSFGRVSATSETVKMLMHRREAKKFSSLF